MLDFFFLSEEQLFGIDKLDIFKKKPALAQASITDYAILLGGSSFNKIKGRKIYYKVVQNGSFGCFGLLNT